MKIIENSPKNFQKPFEFNKMMNSFYISKKVLSFAREKYRTFLISSQIPSKTLAKRPKPLCNPIWPICSSVLEENKQKKPEIEFLVFRQACPNEFLIYEDYFEGEGIRNKKVPFLNMKDNLVIGRHHHICGEPPVEEKMVINMKKPIFEKKNENSSKFFNFSLYFKKIFVKSQEIKEKNKFSHGKSRNL